MLETHSKKGLPISDITRKVGVTKGALYAHFNSKDEILIRIIEKFKIRCVDEVKHVAWIRR